MTFTKIVQESIKMGYNYLVASNGTKVKLSEIRSNSRGWFFNGAYSEIRITKYDRKGNNLGWYLVEK